MGIPTMKRRTDDTTQQILDLLKQQAVTVSSTPQSMSLFSPRNVNALVIAAIIGVVAFIWTSVTDQPRQQSAQATQIAEIRTTVLALKSDFGDLRASLQAQAKDTADVKSAVDTNKAEIVAMKQNIQSNAERISQLEKDTR